MDLEFIKKAENIWLFIAFCLVIKNYIKDKNYLVKFPIFIDATCSGIQHISAMIKDLESGINVNLVPQNENDKVNDIYSYLLKYINDEINLEGNKLNTEFPNLKHIRLNRNDVKTPIMTKTYSVTLLGMKNQINFSLKKNSEEFIINYDNETLNIDKKNEKLYNIKIKSYLTNKLVELDQKDIFKIAQIIEKSLFIKFPLLNKVYTYFREICKICNKLGLPLVWFTPSGLEISQKYYKTKDHKVALSFAGKTKKLIVKE